MITFLLATLLKCHVIIHLIKLCQCGFITFCTWCSYSFPTEPTHYSISDIVKWGLTILIILSWYIIMLVLAFSVYCWLNLDFACLWSLTFTVQFCLSIKTRPDNYGILFSLTSRYHIVSFPWQYHFVPWANPVTTNRQHGTLCPFSSTFLFCPFNICVSSTVLLVLKFYCSCLLFVWYNLQTCEICLFCN